jgi:O-antigen ligase
MSLKNYHFYLISALLAFTAIIFIQTKVLPIFVIILVFLIMLYGEKFLISLSILLLVLATRTEFNEVRNYIVVISIIILIISFSFKYGSKFNAYPKIPREVILLLIIIGITLFISTSFSTNFQISLISSFRLLTFFLICYLIYALISDSSTLFLLIYILLTLGLLTSISIYYDFITQGFSFFLTSGVLARFTGVYDNPNFVGLITLISSCFIIALFFLDKFKSKKNKTILIFFLLNNILIFLIIASRAAIIGTLIGGAFIIYYLNRKLLFKLLLIFGGFILMLISIPAVQEFLTILIRFQDFSIREYLWASGLEMFMDNPITGVGPQMFEHNFYSYIPSSIISFFELRFDLSTKSPHPHNFFLQMASENGLLGIIMSFSLFSVFFYNSLIIMKNSKNKNREAYIINLALIGIGLGIFFRSFFEVSGIMSYGYISRDLPFWIVFIIQIYIYNTTGKKIIKNNLKSENTISS